MTLQFAHYANEIYGDMGQATRCPPLCATLNGGHYRFETVVVILT